MEFKYLDIVDRKKKEATLRLYGVIGDRVSGHGFADEIAYLDKECDVINIRVNSDGGDVSQGLSIVSAIMAANAEIHVHVDGVAASMAAVIAVCGDRVFMYDYAQLMIHDPFFADEPSNLTPKQKKSLARCKATLQKILSRRGKDEGMIAKLMTAETWFSAEEALANGLIDEIINSSKKENFKGMSPSDIATRISNEYKRIHQKQEKKMDKIAVKLGLPATATEDEIVSELDKRENTISGKEKKVVDHYINTGRKNGSVTDENEDRFRKLASVDFDLFVDMIGEEAEAKKEKEDGERPKTARLSQVINDVKSRGTRASGKDWAFYQRNDPTYLDKLERENPREFKRLLDEYEENL